MNKADVFYFREYSFDIENKTAQFTYAIDDEIFTEAYTFNGSFGQYNQQALDMALRVLFLVAGVSYYKTLLPAKIIDETASITPELAAFLSKTYSLGLREFFYVNNLPVTTVVEFSVTRPTTSVKQDLAAPESYLVAIGGGKDSLVTYDLLMSAQKNVITWSLGHKKQLEPLIEKMDSSNHIWVERTLDPKLIDLNTRGAYNGHIPISAIFAAVSTVLSVLANTKDAVFSNEQSASEPSLVSDGVAINHQYSKSIEFETSYQLLVSQIFGNSYRYYSILRPLSEAKISQMFCDKLFDTYRDVFSSCNRAFTQDSTKISWCGQCAKCAFIFLAFTPFRQGSDVRALWGGKNLLLDQDLKDTYLQLLGLSESGKPLDCVGEIKESRTLMKLAQGVYPELDFGDFDIPSDYDWQALMPHAVPNDIFSAIY